MTHRQLTLFEIRPNLAPGRAAAPQPRDHTLAAALDAHARRYAADKGWGRLHLSKIRSAIRILLGLQHTPGAAITNSEAAILTQVQLPVRDVLDVLADVGMHEDDRTPVLERWFDRKLDGLPGPMTGELRAWFDVMHRGTPTPPRRRPRSPTTIHVYTRRLLPTLHTWADKGHDSLREITRDDILAVLASGSAPAQLGQALRSLFGILKAGKVIFTDPTRRIRTWVDTPLQPPPVDLNEISNALNSTNPARAAITALVAFHGLSTGQLRQAQATDIHDGRLHLEGRTILLAGPVRSRLAAWLDYRHTRWPAATNPHLFLTIRTGRRHDPVSHRWIELTLNIPGAATALRMDRILDEANATSGDTRRLCDLFGLSITAATRYTNTLDHPHLRASGPEASRGNQQR